MIIFSKQLFNLQESFSRKHYFEPTLTVQISGSLELTNLHKKGSNAPQTLKQGLKVVPLLLRPRRHSTRHVNDLFFDFIFSDGYNLVWLTWERSLNSSSSLLTCSFFLIILIGYIILAPPFFAQALCNAYFIQQLIRANNGWMFFYNLMISSKLLSRWRCKHFLTARFISQVIVYTLLGNSADCHFLCILPNYTIFQLLFVNSMIF